MRLYCACDCCTGVTTNTPQQIDNRPGLPAIHYRPGSYAHFRASLHTALTSSDRPALAGLTTRDEDDFSMALVDATACMAEVLSFYTERLVNEAYLRTALDRLSLSELGRLIGYRLRPGVAGKTHLAFHVEPPPPKAVEAAAGPFRRMRMPASVTIPAGVPVRSVPGPGEQQQVFETGEAIEARPEWNLMQPVTTKEPVLGKDATFMYVKGLGNNLKPGDMLLFTATSGWEMHPIAAVEPQIDKNRTYVTWDTALTEGGPLTAHVMRKRLHFFGANAPMWKTMSSKFQGQYAPGETWHDWPYYYSTPDDDMTSDMDGSHPDILVGSYLVFRNWTGSTLYTADSVKQLSRAQFAVSGTVTRVKLNGPPSKYSNYNKKVRDTTVYAVNEKLALADEPLDTLVKDDTVVVVGDVASLPDGRIVLVAGDGKVEKIAVKSATATGSHTTLTFAGNLAHSYTRATLAIFGNVVAATNGETVHQILGDGKAAQPFQRFELKHAPLTYVPSDDPSGASSTLEVRVNDVAWHEVPTLYPAKPGERVFVTRDNASGALEAGMGDGLRGARVPTGQHNVRAVYRKGLGAGGNLPIGALTQLGAPPLGVTGVTNPLPAEGGADPDSAAQARSGIRLFTRTLGRAVSLTDYADYARSFSGIAKAHAAVLGVRHVRTIVVTVAAENGDQAPQSVRDRLTTSLRGHGDPLAPVLVVPYVSIPFGLLLKVRRHPDHELAIVLKAVTERLKLTFGFAAREFAQPVQRSEVIAAAQSAPGVVAIDLDTLSRDLTLTNPVRLAGSGPTINVAGKVLGAELLHLPSVSPTWLSEMPS